VTDNPGMVGALVVDKKLVYATPSAQALAHLQAKAADRYNGALKAAGSELALPYGKRFHALELSGSTGSLQAGR
jgi:hypothetical protein